MVSEYRYQLSPFHGVPISQELGLIRKIKYCVNLQLDYLASSALFCITCECCRTDFAHFFWCHVGSNRNVAFCAKSALVDMQLHHHLNRRSSSLPAKAFNQCFTTRYITCGIFNARQFEEYRPNESLFRSTYPHRYDQVRYTEFEADQQLQQ